MAVTFESVVADAAQLSPSERTKLIEHLVESAEPPLHPAWRAEIARRLTDLDAGRSRLIPADEAMARLDRHIRERRQSTP